MSGRPSRRRAPTILRGALPIAAAFLTTWLLPGLAAACTVCMGGQEEESRKAFVGTTAFLTFFPLLMLGVAVTWFVRRALAHERAQQALIDAARAETSSERATG